MPTGNAPMRMKIERPINFPCQLHLTVSSVQAKTAAMHFMLSLTNMMEKWTANIKQPDIKGYFELWLSIFKNFNTLFVDISSQK